MKINKEDEISDSLKITHHSSQRLVFNFSFLTKDNKYNLDKNNKKISKEIKAKVLERMYQLSVVDKVTVLGYDKVQGLEKIHETKIKSLNPHPDYEDYKIKEECGEDCWIFRISKKGRVIGKMNDNIFYIIKIDTDFKSYKH